MEKVCVNGISYLDRRIQKGEINVKRNWTDYVCFFVSWLVNTAKRRNVLGFSSTRDFQLAKHERNLDVGWDVEISTSLDMMRELYVHVQVLFTSQLSNQRSINQCIFWGVTPYANDW